MAFESRKQEKAAEVGKTIVEGAKNHERKSVREKWEGVTEAYETQKEAVSDETALYTSLQADIIEEALEPALLGLDAVNTMDLQLNQGVDSIQIPSGTQLEAVDLNADGSLAEDTSSYDPTTVDINWVGVRTTFSGQILDKSRVDLLAFRMEQAGRAIARRVDSDILSEIEDAGSSDGSYGDNSNYDYLGADSAMGYTDVINAVAGAADNDANVDLMVANPTTWANFMTDSDTVQSTGFGTSEDGEVPMVQQFGPVSVFMTGQVPANKALFVDTERAGMFVDASEVQTFDGRVNENYQFEILAVKAYGVSIVQPETVYVVHEEAAPA